MGIVYDYSITICPEGGNMELNKFPEQKKPWYITYWYVIAGICLLLLIVNVQNFFNRTPKTEPEKRLERLEKFNKMSAKEHLVEANKIYGTINIDQDQLGVSEQKVFTIKRHLKAIAENSFNYKEAQSVLKELSPIDDELKKRKGAATLEQQKKQAPDNIQYVKSSLERLKKDNSLKQNSEQALALIVESKKKLENIKEDFPEYAEVPKLSKELLHVENEIYKETRELYRELGKAYEKGLMQSRMVFAEELERNYLRKGMDVNVRLLGQNKTTIRLEYILFSRPMVYKLTNETELLDVLKNKGFKEVIFYDTYRYTWKYDL
jgi:hypothetical protein